MKRTELELMEALSYCSISKLPPKDDGSKLWVRALASIVKIDCSKSYAYVEVNPETLEPRLIKVFGSPKSIARIESYHPFDFIGDKLLPKFNTQKKDERIIFLSRKMPHREEEFKAMTLAKLEKEIKSYVIKQKLNKL